MKSSICSQFILFLFQVNFSFAASRNLWGQVEVYCIVSIKNLRYININLLPYLRKKHIGTSKCICRRTEKDVFLKCLLFFMINLCQLSLFWFWKCLCKENGEYEEQLHSFDDNRSNSNFNDVKMFVLSTIWLCPGRTSLIGFQ